MADGNLVLQLHHRDVREHPGMWAPNIPVGNGMPLWFRADNFEPTVSQYREATAEVVAEPHLNPNAKQCEIWFRDPGGYLVVVSDSVGDAV